MAPDPCRNAGIKAQGEEKTGQSGQGTGTDVGKAVRSSRPRTREITVNSGKKEQNRTQGRVWAMSQKQKRGL